jgi:hypothetical protein
LERVLPLTAIISIFRASKVSFELGKGGRVQRILKLLTSDGNPIRIQLEHRGSGVDERRRRWILAEDYWHCVDTDEIAQEARFGPPKNSPDLTHAGAHPYPKLRQAVFFRAGGQCECIAPEVRSILKVLLSRCGHVGRCNALLRGPWELYRLKPGPYEASNVKALCQACYRNASGLARW